MTVPINVALKYIESENKYRLEDRALYHYNCAEVVLNACNDYYDLKASDAMLRALYLLVVECVQKVFVEY